MKKLAEDEVAFYQRENAQMYEKNKILELKCDTLELQLNKLKMKGDNSENEL